ncbi:MAG: 4-alpha-glucanotransferase [Rikenellaceae bacterium]
MINSSSVVTDILWARAGRDNIDNAIKSLKISLPPEMRVVMVGECEALGGWNPLRGVKLLCRALPDWYLPGGLSLAEGTQYKFVILKGDELIAWEQGENRRWQSTQELGEFRGAPQIYPRLSGVAIPLFSIRSAGCEGIGDFVALGDFAQWAASASMSVVQILPINDTTIEHSWRDSYPYNAISIYALHPLYIRISEMDSKADISDLHALEGSAQIDYDEVDRLKWQHFRSIYKRKGAATFKTKAYVAFFDANREWLLPYAAFSLLRDEFNSSDYTAWPKPYCKYSKSLVSKLSKERSKEMGLYLFLQYHADKQLRAARGKARKAGVVFKGDIPIGVSRHSVEVWVDPHLFNLTGQAGAPPDDFSVDGQNWGFPTYNWQAMAKDGYSWWQRRFRKMADYFDLYRVDHVLGFFRIWDIPMPHKSGLLGHFSPSLPFSAGELAEWGLPMYEDRYLGESDDDLNTLFLRDSSNPELYHPRISAYMTDKYKTLLDAYERDHYNAIYDHYFYHRHNQFWGEKAMEKLPALIGATSMMCCAEDLGMIPGCVGGVLDSLQVLTLEIERMPKDPSLSFARPDCYPVRSVATTSTHDMSTIRGWWQEDPALTQRYYNEMMQREGDAPRAASAEICRWIVEQHLLSPSMVAILPLQDLLSISDALRREDVEVERINIPANPRHYWRYRMHLSVDELIESAEFNRELSSMIKEGKR